jgi:hypothetical protein
MTRVVVGATTAPRCVLVQFRMTWRSVRGGSRGGMAIRNRDASGSMSIGPGLRKKHREQRSGRLNAKLVAGTHFDGHHLAVVAEVQQLTPVASPANRSSSAVRDLGDMRMVERCEELCFAFESAPSIAIVREGSRHYFERASAACQLRDTPRPSAFTNKGRKRRTGRYASAGLSSSGFDRL